MSAERFDEETLSLHCLKLVDELCARFVSAASESQRPTIESLLEQVPNEFREAALFYLLREERELAGEHDPRANLENYLDRFPAHSQIVLCAWDADGEFEVELEVIIGPHRGRRFLFRQHDSFVVGRSAVAHFQLATDPFFSRVHFLVEVNPPQCRLVDLDSLNGTQVNRHDVDWADLRNGDLIVAGNTVIRVRISAPETSEQFESIGPVATVEPNPRRSAETETQALAPQPALPGYEMILLLGQGGMGEVHLARRTSDGQQVAVKTLRPAARTTQEDMQRFLREAQILCDLQHPHIVGFHQFGRCEEHLYLAMDYVPGSDLGEIVNEHGPLAIERAVKLVSQALEALAFAHARGYVHRDVKPSNLLVSGAQPAETCQLTDFGLARVYYESRMSGLTLLGTAGGTLQFMAPEQVTNFRGVGPAADQYGAAATLYYICTGKPLFPPDELQQQRLMNVLETAPIPMHQQRPDMPIGLARIVHKALAKDPQERFPDVLTFRAAILAYSGVAW